MLELENCSYCSMTYSKYEYHSCLKYTNNSFDIPDTLDLGLISSQEPKIFMTENPMYDTLDIEIYIPFVQQKYAARVTKEFLAYTSPINTYNKLCELFGPAIKVDPRVRDLIRKNVLSGNVGYPDAKYAIGGYVDGHGYPYSTGLSRSKEIDHFPGVKELVMYPGEHAFSKGLTMTLESAIINLNDKDKWTREQIADWLETLDVDIRFKTKENDDE